MKTEILLYSLHQWRLAGASLVKIVVSDRESGELIRDLYYGGYDFLIEFQMAPGIKVFVINTDGGNAR
jgi:hypothetical protein